MSIGGTNIAIPHTVDARGKEFPEYEIFPSYYEKVIECTHRYCFEHISILHTYFNELGCQISGIQEIRETKLKFVIFITNFVPSYVVKELVVEMSFNDNIALAEVCTFEPIFSISYKNKTRKFTGIDATKATIQRLAKV